MAPNPARIFDALFAYRLTAALKAGIELDVFTTIAQGATTAAEIGAKCGAAERGVRILCDFLVTHELLTKDGDRYANTPDGAVFLDSRSPAWVGSVGNFLTVPEMVTATMSTTVDCVRAGGTVMPGAGTVDPENPMWVAFAENMVPMMMPSAHAIAAHMPRSGPLKVLDLAAGHGMFGITIAQHNPEAQITALDWRAVLEVAKRNAGRAGVQDRLSTIPGSAFDVEFGEGYDVVLITNFLHHFSPEVNEGLLRKIHAALKPGGRAITLEFVPDDSRVTPPDAARFALTMLTTTKQGDAYTFAELEAMFRNAGFSHSVHHRLPVPESVIISTK